MISNALKPAKGSVRKKRRVGRGNASGWGGESGRGHKGQKSRSGYKTKPGFEGGQTPLYRRLPKKNGFTNINAKECVGINLSAIQKYFNAVEDTLTISMLRDFYNVKEGTIIKILGDGELTAPFKIQAHKVSKAAAEKIEKSGSTIELVSV